MTSVIRIGTRKSKLALWQAEWCAAQLSAAGIEVELVHLVTSGDVTIGPLSVAGGEGLFTKRIQQALLDEEVDLAVHSLKDLPTTGIEGLELTAVPTREDVHDCLVSNQGEEIDRLPENAIVGTGSIRRQAQLLHRRPDLRVEDIRGNVETRLAKLDQGDYHAVILAAAGLKRLGLAERISQSLPLDWMLPAVGQAALGIECRCDDIAAQTAAATLNDSVTMAEVTAERALLRTLRAGCLAPVGCHAVVVNDALELNAAVLSRNGSERLTIQHSGPASSARELGEQAAERLIEQGADRLLADSRNQGD